MLWILVFFAYSVDATKCRGLALSGGGSYGAYQAGVFYGLVHHLPAEEVQYNIMTGISAGSLNSALIAQFALGSETMAADHLLATYATINGSSYAFTTWPGGYLAGLLFHGSLVSTKPELELLTSLLTSVERNITQGCVDLDTGKYVSFNETRGVEGLIQSTMCSSAIPALFPWIDINNAPLVDGGVVYRVDFFEAVDRCLTEVEDPADVTIDMVECYAHYIDFDDKDLNSINVIMRLNDINAFDKGMHNLYWAMTAYPEVNFRYYFQPSQNLPGIVSLDWSQEALQKSIKIGRGDAAYNVENNIYAKDVLSNWINSQKIFYPE